MKETLKQAGYVHLWYEASCGAHALYNISTRKIELFQASKNSATWGIRYKNTHLEFCSEYGKGTEKRFIAGLERIQNYGEQHPSFKTAHNLLARMQLLH